MSASVPCQTSRFCVIRYLWVSHKRMPQRCVFDTRNLGTSRRGGLPDDGHARATGLTAMNAVLNEDRACRGREQAIRIASVLALALLCPALLWCAAYGTT